MNPLKNDNSNAEGFLEFTVASAYFAIPISTVREINPVGEITPVPRAATHICGVMNLRGQVLPVIDLRVRLHGQLTQRTHNTCVIVIHASEGDVGVLVDSVCRVVSFPEDKRLEAPAICNFSESSLVHGVAQDGHKTVTLLKMDECVRKVDCNQIRRLESQRESFHTAPAAAEKPAESAATHVLRSAALKLMD